MTISNFSRRHILAGAMAVTTAPALVTLGFGTRARAAEAAPAPPPLSAYSKLPMVNKVALSPDGSRVAMTMNKNGQLLLVDYELATGKAAAAAVDNDKIRHLMWADNSHVLVVTTMTQHDFGDMFEEQFGLIMDIPGGKRTQMYAFVSGVNKALVSGDFYRIIQDGKYFITASGWRHPDGMNLTNSDGGGTTYSEVFDRCLYAFNPASSAARKLDEDSRVINDWAIRADGTIVARSEFDDDTKVWTLRYKSEKGWTNIYQVKAEYDAPSLSGLGRDGKSLLVYFRSGEYQDKYIEIEPDGTFGTPINVNGANHYPIFHPTDLHLAGFGNDDGVATYVFYDETFAKLPKLIKGAVGDIRADLVGWADDPLHVLIFVEGEGNSGTYYSIDFRKGGYKEIGAAYPDLAAEWVSEKKPYTYKAADGLDIPAWLTLPVDRDPKGLALVVLPHGGPESYDDSHFDFLAQALSSRGYAVLQPNYRGSAGYGREYTARGYGEFGRKMQTDLSDGVRALVREGVADAKRVSIFGGSYGGYAALAGVTLDPGVYNCAVALAGLSDIKAFMDYRLKETGYDHDSYSMDYWNRFLGDDKLWDEITPVKHIDAVTVPVMLIHGKDDTVVPFDQSTRFYDAMKKAGKSVELVQLKEEDHWMSREPTRMQIVDSMVSFMLTHNPPAHA